MSVLRCLWHGAQLRLKRRDSVCVHCRLGQRIPLWDGSYNEGVPAQRVKFILYKVG